MKFAVRSIACGLLIMLCCVLDIQAVEKPHSRADLSDNDRISLLLQRLNRAITARDINEFGHCLNPDIMYNRARRDSVFSRFDAVLNRLDELSSALIKEKRLPSDAHLASAVHIENEAAASIMPDGARLKVNVYLGDNPFHYKSLVDLHLSKWLGMYGVSNPTDLCDALDESMSSLLADPNLLDIRHVAADVSNNVKSTDEISNFLVHKPFYSDGGKNTTIDVFTRSEAQANFEGKNLFSRAHDILETIVYDPGLGDAWGMVSSDGNWNRFIAFADRGYSGQPVIFGRDYHMGPQFDQENISFNFPAGISLLTDQDLFVCDYYNNQIGVYWINLSTNQLEDVAAIGNRLYGNLNLNNPIDVDAGHIPMYLPDIVNCSFRNWLVICDQGNNRVVLTDRQGGDVCELGGDSPEQYLNRPTAVAFGRDEQSGWQTFDVYVVDNGNNRVVRFACDFCCDLPPIYDGFITTDAGIFETDAYLSSIDVDGFGQVYVLDSYNGYVYKFASDLTYIGRWGGIGTDVDHLYFPARMAITRGWQNEYVDECGDEILVPARMGDVLITDFYTDTTGIKRYRFRNEISDFAAEYQMRDCNSDTLAGDRFDVEWYQDDFGRIEVDFAIAGEGIVEQYSQLCRPGYKWLGFSLPYDAPENSLYAFTIRLYSPYGGALEQELSRSGVYDRGDCNYPPYIDSTYLVGNDSCFMTNTYGEYVCSVAVQDNDHAPNELTYIWETYPDIGSFCFYNEIGMLDSCTYMTTTNENHITLETYWGKETPLIEPMGVPYAIFGVRVEDPLGGWIARYHYMPLNEGEHSCEPDTAYTSGCPILYYDDKGEWRLVNNLIAEIEGEKTLAPVSEIYPVYDISTDQSGEIRLRITEETDEVSSLKSIRAAIVDYPTTVKPVFTNHNNLFALGDKRILPTVAYTEFRDTITGKVNKEDGNYFSDTGPGQIIIEYDLGKMWMSFGKSLSDIPGGTGIQPPDKGHLKRLANSETVRSGLYEVLVLSEHGDWAPVAAVYPRLVHLPQYVELADFIFDNHLVLRIDYDGDIELDCLPFYLFTRLDVSPQPLRLASAYHSINGKISDCILEENSSEVVLKEGEYLDLVFQGRPPKAGYKQLLLLSTRGRYEKAESGIGEEEKIVFNQNYPNPFNPNTNFSFYLPSSMPVKLKIYNVLGQVVRVLVDGPMETGNHVVPWDSRNNNGEIVASGVYFTHFMAGDYTASKKIEVLK